MIVVNTVKHIIGLGGDSGESHYWERVGGLLSAMALTATSTTQSIFSSADNGKVSSFFSILNIFFGECEPLNPGSQFEVCDMSKKPHEPNVTDSKVDMALTAISATFHIVILLIMLREVNRLHRTSESPVEQAHDPIVTAQEPTTHHPITVESQEPTTLTEIDSLLGY